MAISTKASARRWAGVRCRSTTSGSWPRRSFASAQSASNSSRSIMDSVVCTISPEIGSSVIRPNHRPPIVCDRCTSRAARSSSAISNWCSRVNYIDEISSLQTRSTARTAIAIPSRDLLPLLRSAREPRVGAPRAQRSNDGPADGPCRLRARRASTAASRGRPAGRRRCISFLAPAGSPCGSPRTWRRRRPGVDRPPRTLATWSLGGTRSSLTCRSGSCSAARSRHLEVVVPTGSCVP